MDAKEIEAFLLMEQQRTLEANLFDSNTNTSAWAQTALPWLQVSVWFFFELFSCTNSLVFIVWL